MSFVRVSFERKTMSSLHYFENCYFRLLLSPKFSFQSAAYLGILYGPQVLELCSSCNYRINTGLWNLVVDSDFIISAPPKVSNIDPPTFSAWTLCNVSVFFLKPFDYSEMTGTKTTAHPQPHQDVLFLNNKCCNQHDSCQAILYPDVVNQLHNSIGGPHKLTLLSTTPLQPPTWASLTLQHSTGFNGLFHFFPVSWVEAFQVEAFLWGQIYHYSLYV